MNDENLKKGKATQFRTGEEQAKIAQKGGKKSGEVRRMRSIIRKMIENTAPDDEKLIKENLLEGNNTYLEIIIANLIKKAKNGDAKAIDQVMELLDEKKTSIEITPTDGEDRERWLTEYLTNAQRATG